MSGVICREEPKLAERFLFVRGNKNLAFQSISYPPINVAGFIRTLLLPTAAALFTKTNS
jgi:hypothetical protein